MNSFKTVSSDTPEPQRAYRNLLAFSEGAPETVESMTEQQLHTTALLFACSQFLANYAVKYPTNYLECLVDMDTPIDAQLLRDYVVSTLTNSPPADMFEFIRRLKYRYMLHITLRNLTGRTDVITCMTQLSALADVIIETANRHTWQQMTLKYGTPSDDRISVIALGKLGASELNYSSDVDLIFCYGSSEGQTTGVVSQHGVTMNRLSNHEYYCKGVELFAKLLNQNTPDGFAYRVDLRLRPQGAKGELALSLSGYEQYYESWGREWERVALIRARHVAGDRRLGAEFIDMIRPFVYRKYIDMRAIDEIKKLKRKIDQTFNENDIKKGFGGIREVEFFAQALQLVYGGQQPLLRQLGLILTLHRLSQKNLIGYDDFSVLSENYLYLRKLEHYLQMLNDTQTQTLPSDPNDMHALARKMAATSTNDFLTVLKQKRTEVRAIYDSLFQPKPNNNTGNQTDNSYTEDTLREILRQRQAAQPERIVHLFRKIRDNIGSFQTLRGRRLQDVVIPAFLREAVNSKNPAMALSNLHNFTDTLKTDMSYLELFDNQRALIKAIVEVFATSAYLSAILMSSRKYMEVFAGGTPIRKTLGMITAEVGNMLRGQTVIGETLATCKKMEELRLGIMYLNRRITIRHLTKGLSKLAVAILTSALNSMSSASALHIIAFGKLGGREITINSDLDIIFVCRGDVDEGLNSQAERLLRILTSYTREGRTYNVDTRLRADGSKGTLVKGLDALEDYYLNRAYPWEIQALLRARPLTGDAVFRARFMAIRANVIANRCREITPEAIVAMRDRIRRERLSATSAAIDIKLSVGGIEDIEFLVQYLQLRHALISPSLLVQNTVAAIGRLVRCSVLDEGAGRLLINNYLFYRNVETIMRLTGEPIETLSGIEGFTDARELIEHIKVRMGETESVVQALMQ
ncbi:MAG: bifunctional [glutamate--ammonia ligase]-adenylyl-L-tyrosine phosphorylase/[glutamate--ammonia-ligase] adenylyltransferase [Nitrospirae bacterium]|uniref:bifunctional [glutamate--ammonia ligase]-adenylyl-L-tyrosine phosphorylase/[glutamate--ammonia-ligase] adenylyltransferase n=1 Tax=Candidatus Magnetobacterium casense TaxID=1455061 RepID=UPI00058DF91C|nr:bifunctional [glutamate--ammonia ligase]-adenylyl-L-tyrosine phosphorylase/[glutamate--ammonia-ligase] adenylyltransferase [Candidatus Magnetobacterium casensis]MBF0338001.1 bifunctional [glutamate--ammonia ligase]-adenylyl-L-tyrosine phosphorylase/[glutamate--ammonia-ligase] adenylyltransferase [Nitrospirota bacterium]